MGITLAQLLMQDKADYVAVIKKYSKYKDEIDFILKAEGFEHLISK